MSAELVSDVDTGVRGDSHADNFLDLGRVKILNGLAGVAAGDQHIDSYIEPAIEERSNECGSEIPDRGPQAFPVWIRFAASSQRFSTNKLEFTACL
jgi:hypothetical protein